MKVTIVTCCLLLLPCLSLIIMIPEFIKKISYCHHCPSFQELSFITHDILWLEVKGKISMMLEVLVLVVLDTHMMRNGLFKLPGV